MRPHFLTPFTLKAQALSIFALLSGCIGLTPSPGAEDLGRLDALTIPRWENLTSNSSQAASGHSSEVLDLKQLPHQPSRVISVGSDGAILEWDLKSGAAKTINTLSARPKLAAFGSERALVAWDSGDAISVGCVSGCDESWRLTRLKTRVTSLAFHEADQALLIGGVDGRVYRWRFQLDRVARDFKEKDKSLERYIGHQTIVSSVLPLHTGRAFFSADWDGQLYAWLAYTADDQKGSYDRNLFGGRFFGTLGTYIFAARAADRGITSMALSADGTRLALGTDDGYIELWEVKGFEMIARQAAHTGRVVSVSLNDNGTRLASIGRDAAIAAHDIIPDPEHGIRIGALRSRAVAILKETMQTARQARFLSSGDLIISTPDGKLGELRLNKIAPTTLPTPPKVSAETQTTQKGSDY
ncbi:MAG: WD40 repeat domain-containing protein [Pseudomonadota bacterium]